MKKLLDEIEQLLRIRKLNIDIEKIYHDDFENRYEDIGNRTELFDGSDEARALEEEMNKHCEELINKYLDIRENKEKSSS